MPAWIGRTAHTCWTVTHQLLYHKLHHSLNVISDNAQHTHSMTKREVDTFWITRTKGSAGHAAFALDHDHHHHHHHHHRNVIRVPAIRWSRTKSKYMKLWKSTQRDANTAHALAVIRCRHRPSARCPPHTHRQDWLQYTVPQLASAQWKYNLLNFQSLYASFYTGNDNVINLMKLFGYAAAAEWKLSNQSN